MDVFKVRLLVASREVPFFHSACGILRGKIDNPTKED